MNKRDCCKPKKEKIEYTEEQMSMIEYLRKMFDKDDDDGNSN